jgi:hypothetical protein
MTTGIKVAPRDCREDDFSLLLALRVPPLPPFLVEPTRESSPSWEELDTTMDEAVDETHNTELKVRPGKEGGPAGGHDDTVGPARAGSDCLEMRMERLVMIARSDSRRLRHGIVRAREEQRESQA